MTDERLEKLERLAKRFDGFRAQLNRIEIGLINYDYDDPDGDKDVVADVVIEICCLCSNFDELSDILTRVLVPHDLLRAAARHKMKHEEGGF